MSICNVDHSKLSESIDKVILSYGKNSNSENLVLIQPMIKNVYLSGVFLSSEPNKNADYFVINYNYGLDTSAVTSGKKCLSRYIYKHKNTKYDFLSKILINLYYELQKILKIKNLDIEFALDKKQLYLLQVRQIPQKN